MPLSDFVLVIFHSLQWQRLIAENIFQKFRSNATISNRLQSSEKSHQFVIHLVRLMQPCENQLDG